MRLKLVSKTEMNDPAEKGWRLLERGELTLGRASDCGWRLDDPDRTLSKVHCRIMKDASGFLLRDESTNGVTVDGVDLAGGQSVRLSNGSSIRLGDFGFTAEITGVEEPDWSDPDPALTLGDDDLTVTSIIADVSPGGRTASGMVPGRSGDEWIEAQGEREAERLPGAPALRDAEIGWSGPPDLRLVQTELPDDWNTSSDVAGRTEHMAATSARVRVAKAAEPKPDQPTAPPAPRGDEAEAMVAALLAGARLPPSMPTDPAAFMRQMGGVLRGALDRAAALETAAADFFAEHGVDRPAPDASVDPTLLSARLDQLIDDQKQLHDAVRAVLDDFAQRLDPRAIEARADAKAASRPLAARLQGIPMLAERAYWAAYREAFRSGGEGGGMSVKFREALGGKKPVRSADGFEELRSDLPQGGVA